MGSRSCKVLKWLCGTAAVASLGLGVISCNEHDIEPFSTGLKSGRTDVAGLSNVRPVDILFVVDSTTTMTHAREELTSNLQDFLKELVNVGADFKIGFTGVLLQQKFSTADKENEDSLFDLKQVQEIISRKIASSGKASGDDSKCLNDVEEYVKVLNQNEVDFKKKKTDHRLYSYELVAKDVPAKDDNERIEKIKNIVRCTVNAMSYLVADSDQDPIERGLQKSIRVLEGQAFTPIYKAATDYKSLSAGFDLGEDNPQKPSNTEAYPIGDFADFYNKVQTVTKAKPLKYVHFLRPKSILSILYMSDENDCSSLDPRILNLSGATDVQEQFKCEYWRNIEDSCTLSKADAIFTDDAGKQAYIKYAEGPFIEDQKKYLRQICVSGDRGALITYSNQVLDAFYQAALKDQNIDPQNPGTLSDEQKEKIQLSVNQSLTRLPINCPIHYSPDSAKPFVDCINALLPRKMIKFRLINYMLTMNKDEYESLDDIKKSEGNDKINKMAQAASDDIIIATVVNRDVGIRYPAPNFDISYCGGNGAIGYRYEQFANMFKGSIFAPICCNEEFGSICKARDEGVGKFSIAMQALGKRIGESVSTICLDSKPVTCEPSICESDDPTISANCPCSAGCNHTEYLSGTKNAYHLCNEFDMRVGEARLDDDRKKLVDIKYYTPEVDYKVNYNSNYCQSRSGSGIQVNLLKKVDVGYSVLTQYPRAAGRVLK